MEIEQMDNKTKHIIIPIIVGVALIAILFTVNYFTCFGYYLPHKATVIYENESNDIFVSNHPQYLVVPNGISGTITNADPDWYFDPSQYSETQQEFLKWAYDHHATWVCDVKGEYDAERVIYGLMQNMENYCNRNHAYYRTGASKTNEPDYIGIWFYDPSSTMYYSVPFMTTDFITPMPH